MTIFEKKMYFFKTIYFFTKKYFLFLIFLMSQRLKRKKNIYGTKPKYS